MNSITNLSSQQLRQAADLKDKIASLQNEITQILGTQTKSNTAVPKRKSKMSAAGRARIVAAQKARWAKIKGKNQPAQLARKAKRTLSAAARAKMAAAAKARWAKVKAAGKKKL